MTSPAARKGNSAERELVGLIRDLTGIIVPRLRLAGTKDLGDIHLGQVVIQIKNYRDIASAVRKGLAGAEEQRKRAGLPFGAAAIRRRGGKWVVVMELDQWLGLWRDATVWRNGSNNFKPLFYGPNGEAS